MLESPRLLSIYPYVKTSSTGLGNLLFPFFRSILSSIYEQKLCLYPFSSSLPTLHSFSHKSVPRAYSQSFLRFSDLYLSRAKSACIYYLNSKSSEALFSDTSIKIFDGMRDRFSGIIQHRNLVRTLFCDRFLEPLIINADVAFHIRLGDFIRTKQATNPELLSQSINFFAKNSSCIIYSDSSPKILLTYFSISHAAMQNLIFYPTDKCPLDTLWNLSNHSILVGNPLSSFFCWAVFLSSLNTVSFSLGLPPPADSPHHFSDITFDHFFT